MTKAKFILVFLALTSVPARADEGFSRLGAEMKAIQTPIGMGILFGWRYLFHSSPFFSIGGAGYLGQISSGTTSSYSYGGMIGAFHIPLTNGVAAEVTILGGGGGGRLGDGTFFGGTVLEPGLGFSFRLGKDVQMVAGASYVWMPGSTSGTGISGGFRFEFLSDNRPEPVVPRESRELRAPVAVAPANPAPQAAPMVRTTPVAPTTRATDR